MTDAVMSLRALAETSADPDVPREMIGFDAQRPDEPSIRWLAGAILLAQDDEWAVQRCRTMTLECIASIGDDPLVSLPHLAV